MMPLRCKCDIEIITPSAWVEFVCSHCGQPWRKFTNGTGWPHRGYTRWLTWGDPKETAKRDDLIEEISGLAEGASV